MITYVVGDLFRSPAQVLVNTVNTVGVMGKGIAADFKRIYPDMFKQYQTYCERNLFNIGQLWIYKTSHKWILNFPTKTHWRQKSKPEYIEAGLKKFVDTYDSKGITSISFPMLGCGNGELDWETQVRPLMEKYLAGLPIDIFIHLYEKNALFSPEHRNITEIENWLRGEPQSLAFSEFWNDLKGLITEQHLSEITQNHQEFDVSMDEDSPKLILNKDNKQIVFVKDSLVDLWQHIRASGFCMGRNLPTDFTNYTTEIINLLSELPYIHPVLMADTYSYHERQLGLQLVPQVSKESSEPHFLKPA